MDLYEIVFWNAKGSAIGNPQSVRYAGEIPPIVRGGMALSNCVRISMSPAAAPDEALDLWVRPGMLVLG